MQRPLRGAIAGFGFIAERGHLPAYRQHPERFHIQAVAETCEARARLAREQLPEARVYSSVAAMLSSERDLDFIDISTPPSEHAAIAHAAFDRGLHVLCEKPITTSAADAHALLEHAFRANRVFFPSHNYRHAPVVRAVREQIESGALGTIHLVTLQTFRPTHAKGVAEWEPNWRRMQRYSGGGVAMDHASHSFYLAFEWLGAYPTSVSAHVQHRANLDTEDDFSCTIDFPTGKAITHLTWNAGVRKVMYSLHGDKGALIVEDDELELTVRANGSVTRTSAASHWMDASHAAWFGSLQEDFLNAVRDGDIASKQAIDSVRSIELIETAYASARAGSRLLNLPLAPVPRQSQSAS